MRTLALLLSLLIPSTVLAASEPPPGLAGTLAIVSSTATTVTLHAEQTGGDPVTLKLEHTCYNADDTAWKVEKVSFVGSVTATFSLAPFQFKGKTQVPDNCHALLLFYYSSSRVVVLSDIPTLP